MKPVKNYPNYFVDTLGNVYGPKGKMKPQDNGNGYWKVILCGKPKNWQVYVHRLVAEAFIENPNEYRYIDHINRNKNDNNVENLRWVSASENTKNMGTEQRYNSNIKTYKKRTDEEKEKARELFKQGYGVMEISRMMSIPRQSISRFVKI